MGATFSEKGTIVAVAHNQNSALGHQNSENQLSKQRMDYIATCKIVLIITAQNNYAIICNYL